jgi:glycosyltransferase involved in cell wall biosynthesis
MKILWIKTEFLHPVDKGGRIRTYQMLRSLRKDHHVVYLTLDDGQAAPDALERSAEYAQEVVTVPVSLPGKLSVGFFVQLFTNLFSALPYAVSRYRFDAMRSEIKRLAAQADIVISDFLVSAVNCPDDLPVPAVLFQHNVEAMIWERHATVPQNFLRRWYMRMQWQRMRRFESAECKRFAAVIAVSRLDAEVMAKQYDLPRVSHVETGVDVDFFTPLKPRVQSGSDLVFVGSMDWMPNADGIKWFAESVFPQVQALVPDSRLIVVGRFPSAGIREMATRNAAIEVTGSVPDVRPYFERAAVSIVPLRIGGGTRLKIYEAMAMGTPVVSTAIGAEGLPLTDGEHLLIADSPEAQAMAIAELVANPTRAASMAQSAQRFVRENCGWDSVAQQFLEQSRHLRTRSK